MSLIEGPAGVEDLAARLLVNLERHIPGLELRAVEHFMPLLFLSLAHSAPGVELPPGALEIIGRFAREAGLDGGLPEDELARAVARYYELHPVPEGVRRGFEQLMRELGMNQSGSDLGARAREALLGPSPVRLPPTSAEPRPEGTTAAGPLARSCLEKF